MSKNVEKGESSFSNKSKRRCEECGNLHIKYKFCIICQRQYFIRRVGTWTSNNSKIDKFIKDTQTNAIVHAEFFEWIPWFDMDLIEHQNDGLYSKVYSAYWIDGPVLLWDKTLDCYTRNGPIKVAIKRFNDSQNPTQELIDRLYSFHRCVRSNYVVDCFGITRDNSSCFCLVMKYYEGGNLYDFLDVSNGVLCWRDIVEILWSISNGLNHIHREKLVHGNLHGGNVLIDNENDFIYTCIGDIGLNIFAKEIDNKENMIYGVLPYIAPEVLSGEKSSYESDVYSFGILMWTLAAGFRPFSDVPHDEELAKRIILNRERPSIIEGSPKSYNDLMQQCWDHDPSKRPKASTLYETIGSWFTKICDEPMPTEISREFDKAEESKFDMLDKSLFQRPKIHSDAQYVSRPLDFLKKQS